MVVIDLFFNFQNVQILLYIVTMEWKLFHPAVKKKNLWPNRGTRGLVKHTHTHTHPIPPSGLPRGAPNKRTSLAHQIRTLNFPRDCVSPARKRKRR